jgi:predicted amidohydrolase
MVRVAAVQLSIEDRELPKDRLDRVVDQVAGLAESADLVVLPEMWTVGAFNTHLFMGNAQAPDGAFAQRISELAKSGKFWLHAGSIPELHEGGVSNTSLLFDPDGDLVARYRKVHLFGFDEGEAAAIVPGDRIMTVETPLGPTGLSTCYDLRFPEFYRIQSAAGAAAFVIPSGWPAQRIEHWRLLCRARAVENQAVVIGCNSVGRHAGMEMGGCSVIVAASGEVLAEAGPSEEEVITADLDPDDVQALRSTFPVLADRRFG